MCHLNDAPNANTCFQASLEIAQIHKYKILQVFSVLGFAWLAAMYQRAERAALLLGAVDQQILEGTRTLLPHAAFEAAWNIGEQMTLEHVMDDMLADFNV